MEGKRMAMEKILFISDLDGTLLDKNSMLSEYTKNALNELISQGVYFSVATRRTTDAAKFEACDVCAAVENALDDVKAAADYICETHDEDGVVKWMINHIPSFVEEGA